MDDLCAILIMPYVIKKQVIIFHINTGMKIHFLWFADLKIASRDSKINFCQLNIWDSRKKKHEMLRQFSK